MASCANSTVSGITTLSLQDFVQVVDLPSTVAVTSGTYASNVRISRGDVLLIRSHLPTTLTLSYHNADSGGKTATVIDVDSNVKFMVLPPKPKMEDGRYKTIVYETVSDLIKDCPTYFQANVDYDDPYLPGFSVKSGDKFRFVRILHDSRDDRVLLECSESSGNLVRLSSDCKGMFTILPDSRGYTVRELVNQARVPRRLKLSNENVQLKPVQMDLTSSPEAVKSSPAETDGDSCITTCRTGRPHSAIQELPLTFKGIIHLHKPPEMIEISPLGDLDVRWKIPLETDLHVRLFSQLDYEEPVGEDKVVSYKCGEFVEKYEYEFPVLATLLSHGHIHPDLTNHLKNVSDIIVHNVKTTDKLLCLDHRNKHFLIDCRLKATFLESPRTFEKIHDLLEYPLGTYFKVLEDIYTDYPKPVCLHCGDVIVLTAKESDTIRKRWRRSTLGPCQVIRCEKLGHDGSSLKLSLPLDLEFKLEELMDFHKHLPITMDQIISNEVPLPALDVSVVNRQGEDPLPVPRKFKLVCIVSEEIITISPLTYAEASSISPVLQSCIEIPVRHSFLVAYGRKLEFPQGYFVFPTSTETLMVRVEKIRTHVAQRLESAKSNDYEDINYGEVHTGDGEFSDTRCGQKPASVHQQSAMRSCASEGALAGIQVRKRLNIPIQNPIQRLSKALTSMRKKKNRNTRKPESLTELSDKENRVEKNEYQTPPKSPAATSVQEDDPYEQINFELGQSLDAGKTRMPSTSSTSSGSTALSPGSPTVSPGDTALSPGRLTVSPGSTAFFPGSQIVSPGSTTHYPGSPTFCSASPTFCSDSMTFCPDSPTTRSGSSTICPGSPTISAGSQTLVPGSSAVRHPSVSSSTSDCEPQHVVSQHREGPRTTSV